MPTTKRRKRRRRRLKRRANSAPYTKATLDAELDEYWRNYTPSPFKMKRLLDNELNEYWRGYVHHHHETPTPTPTPTPDIEELIMDMDEYNELERMMKTAVAERSGPPLTQFRPHNLLSVTDLASQTWCEHATWLRLVHGRQISAERQAILDEGNRRHLTLELEVHEVVEVAMETREDKYAMRFINMLSGLREMRAGGLTRELSVFCPFVLPDNTTIVWLGGIIDQIANTHPELHATTNNLLPSSPEWYLSDTKTRVHATIPGVAQKRGSRLQLTLYKYMFDSMTCGWTDGVMTSFFTSLHLDPHLPLTQSVATHYYNNITSETSPSPPPPPLTLYDTVLAATREFATFERAQSLLTVEYELQSDHSLIGRDLFTYDEQWLRLEVAYFLQFWSGKRPSVATVEDWKCRYCDYLPFCTKPPAERHKHSLATATNNNNNKHNK